MKDTLRQLPLESAALPTGRPAPRAVGADRGLSAGYLVLCMAGSFLAHGVAFAALSGVGGALESRPKPAAELAFTVLVPPEPVPHVVPEPEPVPVAAPVPQLRARPKVVQPEPQKMAPSEPAEAPAAEPAPPLQTLGSSSESGLSVAGGVGPSSSLIGSLQGRPDGVVGGTGTAAPSAPRIDLRKLAAAWTAEVGRAINGRASREYPRSALRAHLQGAVLLKVHIGKTGKVEDVEVARSSGVESLDQAAVASALGLAQVAPPPEPLHGVLRPFVVPVSYAIR